MLGAYAEWLRLQGGARCHLDGAALAAHPLTAAALAGLRGGDEAFEGAVDAAAELVALSSAGGTGGPDPGMLPLVARLVPAVRRCCWGCPFITCCREEQGVGVKALGAPTAPGYCPESL